MDARLPRSRFGLDLLIGEAKRRMRRRRVLVGFAVVAAAAAVVLTVQPWGGGGGHDPGFTTGNPALGKFAPNEAAIAKIPGMMRLKGIPGMTAMSACNQPISPGGHYPHYCSVLKPREGHSERWILTSAYKQGFRWNATVAFARARPGPVFVTDSWTRFASPRDVAQYMSIPNLTGSYDGSPVPAVNGGIAYSRDAGLVWLGTPKQRLRKVRRFGTGQAISFLWAGGATVVRVTVTGFGLTLEEAQQIALLARPR